jgi:hypothetical protein
VRERENEKDEAFQPQHQSEKCSNESYLNMNKFSVEIKIFTN